ncbi:MAG: SURF1 family protein, partial [Gemmatimonadales bacterium]
IYDHTRQIVLRDFAYQGAPGVRVVSPLHPPAGDSAVLVLRGFVPAPDAMTVELDPLDEPGEIEVEGVALPFPAHEEGPGKLARNGRTTWRRLDLAAVRAEFPYPVRAVYVIAIPPRSDPGILDTRRFGLPIRLEPPPLDDGPHLNYAIQWFAFAVIAVAVGVVAGRRKRTKD